MYAASIASHALLPGQHCSACQCRKQDAADGQVEAEAANRALQTVKHFRSCKRQQDAASGAGCNDGEGRGHRAGRLAAGLARLADLHITSLYKALETALTTGKATSQTEQRADVLLGRILLLNVIHNAAFAARVPELKVIIAARSRPHAGWCQISTRGGTALSQTVPLYGLLACINWQRPLTHAQSAKAWQALQLSALTLCQTQCRWAWHHPWGWGWGTPEGCARPSRPAPPARTRDNRRVAEAVLAMS
eukprot:363378-Chlamydomonas_euryale.AAC.21